MEIGRIFLVTQCPKKMSREYKKQLILLLKDMLLKEIDISLPKSTPALKIKRSHKLLPISHAPQTHSSGIVYVVLVVPMLVLFIVGIIFMVHVHRKLFQFKIIKHVSATA